MSEFDRSFPEQRQFVNEVHLLLLTYPHGVAFRQFMEDHPKLSNDGGNSVRAALNLLRRENKVTADEPLSRELQASTMIYAQ